MNTHNLLPGLLKKLKLHAILAQHEEIALQAERSQWPYQRYLQALCDIEASIRSQNRIQRHIKEAKLPIGKTLDMFEFDKASSVNPAQIVAFAENTQWVHQARNLLIFGPSGVGKTHIAAAIGRRLIEHGVRVFFAKTTMLVQKLQVAYQEHRLNEAIAKLAKFNLIILDDIGYVQKTENETSVLFELIADRYESGSLIITANQPFDTWETIFPTNSMAVAAIDRLIHKASILNINEQSYRRLSSVKTNINI